MAGSDDAGSSPPLGVDERRDRTRARAWFLQVHYRWEAEGDGFSVQAALGETLGQRLVGPRRIDYLERLVGEFEDHCDQVDDALSECLDNWTLDRLSLMDRGILRLGATELLYLPDVPAKVSIQEAVRLAERYGGRESPRFVNGVLDAVYRRRTEE